jgi:hypothetical protein
MADNATRHNAWEASARQVLRQRVRAIQALGWNGVRDRYTDERKGVLSGRTRMVERFPVVEDVLTDSGDLFQTETEVAIEGDSFHIFVSVLYQRRADMAVAEDFIVSRRGLLR